MKRKHSKIIDELGGTKAVAELLGVSQGAVSQYRHRGIPRHWLMYLAVKYPDIGTRYRIYG